MGPFTRFSRPIPNLLHSGRLAGRAVAALAAALAGLPLAALPARALDEIQLQLPLLDTNFTVRLSELRDPGRLLSGNSDLAQLDRATDGAIGRKLIELFNAPLPLQARAFVDVAVGSPLLNQALLILSALGGVDGLPAQFTGEELARAVNQAAAKGPLTMLNILQVLPGKTATVELDRGLLAIQRLARQQETAARLLNDRAPATVDPAFSRPGPLTVVRRELRLPVTYRPEALQVVVINPSQGASGRLAVISHGLWDSPLSFEGWAKHLASHGYTVLLPFHPGSDQSQQQAMLSGKVPPPGPAELRLRPLDVKALIDAAASGTLGLPPGIRTDFVAVLGQSWGATTVLQLAGASPSSTLLRQRCQDLGDPSRNLSWTLQCSFLTAADQAALADPRVKVGVAVSPPMSLLFDVGAARAMNARVLLVSGSRDWVVPPGPEAITPMAREARGVGGGHRVVIASGGDHFNLGSPLAEGGGPLRGLLLAWLNGAFAAGSAAAPAPGAPSFLPPDGWGDATIPLVDVSETLRTAPVATDR